MKGGDRHVGSKQARPGQINAWQEAMALRSTLPAFRRRVERTLSLIMEAAAIGPFCVSYSGGKDSTVLLHLVRQVVPDATTMFIDSGAEMAGTYEMVQHYGVTTVYPKMSLIEMCKYGGYWGHPNPVDPDAEFNFGKVLLDEPANCYMTEHEIAVNAMGLRSQESLVRWITANKRGELYFAQYTQRWHFCPLQYWKIEDIWAYIHGMKLQYHPAYDRMWELGIPLHQQRIGPVLGSDAAAYGRFAHLRHLDSELYHRLLRDFPKIATYV
jgi:predicted phosphoadenosine phosphosulfate sulfurtransferase